MVDGDRRRRSAAVLGAGLLCLGVVLLTACSTAHAPARVAAARTGAAAQASSDARTPSPHATRTSAYPPGHLSGLPTRPGSPALAVKIENTGLGRPQAGVDDADLVFVEQVEGGLTRLLAVYNSRYPTLIGPVRSARADNVDLLAQFGPIAFAYSGAQAGVLSVIAASDLVDDGYNDEPASYELLPGRSAPENLFVDPTALLRARAGVGARDIGLRFSRSWPQGTAATTIDATYPAATFRFHFDPPSRSYTITQDGDLLHELDGTLESTKNVIVEHIQQAASGYVDVLGNATPANVVTGKGEATVYRNGKAYSGTWTRALAASQTIFRDTSGRLISLNPGTTWILLLPPDGTTTSS